MSADPSLRSELIDCRVRRLREPGARRRAGQERPVRDRARAEAPARARPHRLQARLLRLDAVPELHAGVPPAGLRDGRHPELEGVAARTAPTSAWSSTRSTSATRSRTSTRSRCSPATAIFRRSSRSSRRTTSASIGCGVRSSTSDLLANNCDEFIFYDDLIRVQKRTQTRRDTPRQKSRHRESRHRQAQAGSVRSRWSRPLTSLETDYDPVWGSLVKQTLRRVYPGFNESYYGYRTFAELLEDAAKQGVIELELDQQRGNYRVKPRTDDSCRRAGHGALIRPSQRPAPRRGDYGSPRMV